MTNGTQTPLAPSERLGWAIVGLGDFACTQILPAFAACTHSRIAALVSGDAAKARTIAAQYGLAEQRVYSYDTFDSIRDNPAVDVVYIMLPNALHAEYTVRAAQAGKHVMCEKPMAITVAECEQMIAACAAAQRKLMIGYRVHFEPHNTTALDLLRRGQIGALKLIVADHARLLDPVHKQDTWRTQRALAGGGALYDIGIYSLNAARWFADEEPLSVQASVWSTPGDPRFREVEETCSFTLQFPSGLIANCSASYGCERVKRYRLLGSEGYLELDPATEYHGNQLFIGDKDGRKQRVLGPGNQFAGEIDHLSQCILNDAAPRTSGAMGLQDVRIMQAIYAAAQSGAKTMLTPA